MDNDGVICLEDNFDSRTKKQREYARRNPSCNVKDSPVDIMFDNLDKKAVRVLNSIIEETGAHIVISSDWKLYETVENLGKYYLNQGIISTPIDHTPKFDDIIDIQSLILLRPFFTLEIERALEIKHWLDNHPEVTHWVAIDDMNMLEENLKNAYAKVDAPEIPISIDFPNFVHTPKIREGIKQSGVKEKIIKILSN